MVATPPIPSQMLNRHQQHAQDVVNKTTVATHGGPVSTVESLALNIPLIAVLSKPFMWAYNKTGWKPLAKVGQTLMFDRTAHYTTTSEAVKAGARHADRLVSKAGALVGADGLAEGAEAAGPVTNALTKFARGIDDAFATAGDWLHGKFGEKKGVKEFFEKRSASLAKKAVETRADALRQLDDAGNLKGGIQAYLNGLQEDVKLHNALSGHVDDFGALRKLRGSEFVAKGQEIAGKLGDRGTSLMETLKQCDPAVNKNWFSRNFHVRQARAALKDFGKIAERGGPLAKVVENGSAFAKLNDAVANSDAVAARGLIGELSGELRGAMLNQKGAANRMLNAADRGLNMHGMHFVEAERLAGKAAELGKGLRGAVSSVFKNLRAESVHGGLMKVGGIAIGINQTVHSFKDTKATKNYLADLKESGAQSVLEEQRKEARWKTIPNIALSAAANIGSQIAFMRSFGPRSGNATMVAMGLMAASQVLNAFLPKSEAQTTYVKMNKQIAEGQPIEAQEYLDAICAFDKKGAAKTGNLGTADVRYVAKAMEAEQMVPQDMVKLIEAVRHDPNAAMAMESKGKALVNGPAQTGPNYGPGAVTQAEAKQVQTNIASGKAVGALSANTLQQRTAGAQQVQLA